jgi:hypothetical protein
MKAGKVCVLSILLLSSAIPALGGSSNGPKSWLRHLRAPAHSTNPNNHLVVKHHPVKHPKPQHPKNPHR